MSAPHPDHTPAERFYAAALDTLNEAGIPYLLGGGWAVRHYTGIARNTKDLDIFCRSVDHQTILMRFAEEGHQVQLCDVRWLAKIISGDHFMDLIWDTTNSICRVDDDWIARARPGTFLGREVRYVPPEELLWCKMYVMNRERFDGADVNHVLLKQGASLDWARLLRHFDPHWHILLGHLLFFQFIYPADFREIVPTDLFMELLERARAQYDLPPAQERVCRGPIVDQTQYAIDIREWNYKVITIMTV